MDIYFPKSELADLGEIHLHYLDWGGKGQVLLFLAGRGCTAYIYSKFAAHFKDNFRVIALTRRGHGDSDYPRTGYDIETLTTDIRLFLDLLGIEKVILVGHSMSNVEMTHFNALYPDRITKLIFLDGAYDRLKIKIMRSKDPLRLYKPPREDHYTIESYIEYQKRIYPDLAEIWGEVMNEEILHRITKDPNGKVVDKMTGNILSALHNSIYSYSPEDSQIKSPTLSIHCIWEHYYFPDYFSLEQRNQLVEYVKAVQLPIQRECIEQFRRTVPHAKIVEIPQGHHYCFIKHEEIVLDEMMNFLSDEQL